ncbi:myozenin-2b isoform X2 [Pseudochaenichthys georgianus]|uniref:myozenin-2b isoform X2 n=1 Tax=Pseudochaenichthys georgianus TaxID=52239 RepID=UPI00146D6A06|nr:myozenin-2b isoform X2 [Pseudochaenichthys georgianus]
MCFSRGVLASEYISGHVLSILSPLSLSLPLTQGHTHSLALVSGSVKIREDQTTSWRLTPESVSPLQGYRWHTRNPSTGDVMDLGKKLSTPKDIMLEELSLLSNRGSRLFKMRQRRSEKYTFESIQNEANTLLNNDILAQNAHIVEIKVDPPADGNAATPEITVSDMSAENSSTTAKCYHSPWDQAILMDPSLAETLKLETSAPDPKQDLPEFKSFNRVATPFGGFDKAPRGITFKLPEIDLNPLKYPELQEPGVKRPTFNRTACGWISEGTHLILPTVTLEPIPVPESDDL